MTIGERITKELHDKRITQRELAAMIGVSEVSISRYVNEGRVPRANTLGKIAQALGVSADCLLGLENSCEVDGECGKGA